MHYYQFWIYTDFDPESEPTYHFSLITDTSNREAAAMQALALVGLTTDQCEYIAGDATGPTNY